MTKITVTLIDRLSLVVDVAASFVVFVTSSDTSVQPSGVYLLTFSPVAVVALAATGGF